MVGIIKGDKDYEIYNIYFMLLNCVFDLRGKICIENDVVCTGVEWRMWGGWFWVLVFFVY